MTHQIPHSPFSTRLSGSAKVTERRIRNIFQGQRKRPPVPVLILGALLILFCGSLVSCQTKALQNTAGLLEDVTLYETGGMTVAFPNDVYDQLLIFPGEDENTLVNVYEKASYESARADWGVGDDAGFLFSITRNSQADYEQFLMSSVGGEDYFAKDDAQYYCWRTPTDVRVYFSSDDPDADLQEWLRVKERVEDIKTDFAARNGLTLYDGSEFIDRAFVYGGEHLYASYANRSLPMTLVLSQPVRQGEGGIWCVERWYDNDTGTGYYTFSMEGSPQEQGITAMEHYRQLQEQADAGQRDDLLNPQLAALAWLQNYWRGNSFTITREDVTMLEGADFGQTPPFSAPAPVSDMQSLDAETAAAFAGVLENIYFRGVFPDGAPFENWTPPDTAGNDFAVYDVDRDGEPELIVRYTTTFVAGERGLILDYDKESGSVRIEHSGFPSFRFYDNGAIREGWSHNQTWGQMWPYSLWQYDPDSDAYIDAGSVSAWNKSLHEQDFPGHIDQDGDGVVYRICLPDQEWNHFQEEPEKYVDGAEYARWRDPYLEGANEVAPVFYGLTRDNIAALKNGTLGKEVTP